MDEKQLQMLFNEYAKGKGFKDFGEFKSLMEDEGSRKVFFEDSNKELGFKDFNDFNATLGVKKKEPAASSATPSRLPKISEQVSPLQEGANIVGGGVIGDISKTVPKGSIKEAALADKKKNESYLGALWNNVVGSAARLAGGVARATYQFSGNPVVQMERELLRNASQVMGKNLLAAKEKEYADVVKGVVERGRTSASSKEYERKLSEGFDVTDGIGVSDLKGLGTMIPQFIADMGLAVGTGGGSFALQGYDDALSMVDEVDKDRKMSEGTRLAFGLGGAIVIGLLDKLGLDNLVKTPAAKKYVTAKVIKEATDELVKKGVKVTAEQFENTVKQKASQLTRKELSKLVAKKGATSFAIEGGTEAAQEGIIDLLKIAANRIEDKQIFNEEEIKNTAAKRYLNSLVAGGALGFGGGAVLARFQNTQAAIKDRLKNVKTVEDIDGIVAEINENVADGTMTEEEANDVLPIVQNFVDVSQKVPADLIGKNKVEAVELIGEREKISEQLKQIEEQKAALDPAFHNLLDEDAKQLQEREKEINNELAELAKPENNVEEVVAEEVIQQPIELSPDLPEGYELPNQEIVGSKNIVLYRGGQGGKYFSTDKKVAEDYAKNRRGNLNEYELNPNAKIINYEDVPNINFNGINDYNIDEYSNGKDIKEFMDNELELDYSAAEKWAKENGYDAIKYPTEAEVRIINNSSVSLKSKTQEKQQGEIVEAVRVEREPELPEGRKPVTLSGLEEEKRVKAVEARKKKFELTQSEAQENELAGLTKKLSEAKGSAVAEVRSDIRQKVATLNKKEGKGVYDFDGVNITKNGKKVKSTEKPFSPSQIKEDARGLFERGKAFIKDYKYLIDSANLYGLRVDRGDGQDMTDAEINDAISDIADGIPSVQADNLLNALEDSYNKGRFELDFTEKSLSEASANKIYSMVNAMEFPSDAEAIALNYIAGGGKVSEAAINEVVGSVKRAELNIAKKEKKTKRVESAEARSRDYAEKGTETLDEIAHRLWERSGQEVSEREIKDALMDAISRHNKRLTAAKEFLERYNEEFAENQRNKRAEVSLEDFIGGEKIEIGQPMDEVELQKYLEEQAELPIEEEEDLNDLINQYEQQPQQIDISGKVQSPNPTSEKRSSPEIQPTKEGKGNGSPKAEVGKQPIGEAKPKQEDVEPKSPLEQQYEEASQKKGEKAQQKAKEKLISDNFDGIVAQLMTKNKIKRKC